ncbi:MAG: sigma-54-dependent Fis family transcriptional regulator, partial [Bacteroidetes bacterium]|nr:sigma-54-dependent Fis family transcriptional regulator [Fibrella sp.]
MAVRAIKAGATDFVLKPWENDKLLATLHTAVNGRQKQDADKPGGDALVTSPSPPSQSAGARLMIGQSRVMQQVFDTIEQVADTDANILILGENGTGKDLVARAIHQRSGRNTKPFVPVDLGALSESLFESELFGHVKGAFTDARDDRAGRFEEAQGGTIFLDEIGNITLPQQARLLTVLQHRTVTRVGSNKAKAVDVRLICATNAPIYERVADRLFRQDLLYRINTIEVTLPPLRERLEDIQLLTEHFLNLYRKQHNRPVTSVSPALLKQWQQYAWPGNVRELQHTIERAVILARGTMLDVNDAQWAQDRPGGVSVAAASPVRETLQLEDMEKRLIQQALQQHNGNITDVARVLGLSRQALYRRMEKYGL